MSRSAGITKRQTRSRGFAEAHTQLGSDFEDSDIEPSQNAITQKSARRGRSQRSKVPGASLTMNVSSDIELDGTDSDLSDISSSDGDEDDDKAVAITKKVQSKSNQLVTRQTGKNSPAVSPEVVDLTQESDDAPETIAAGSVIQSNGSSAPVGGKQRRKQQKEEERAAKRKAKKEKKRLKRMEEKAKRAKEGDGKATGIEKLKQVQAEMKLERKANLGGDRRYNDSGFPTSHTRKYFGSYAMSAETLIEARALFGPLESVGQMRGAVFTMETIERSSPEDRIACLCCSDSHPTEDCPWLQCEHCHEIGHHFSHNCPKSTDNSDKFAGTLFTSLKFKPVQLSSIPVSCYRCGSSSHLGGDCTSSGFQEDDHDAGIYTAAELRARQIVTAEWDPMLEECKRYITDRSELFDHVENAKRMLKCEVHPNAFVDKPREKLKPVGRKQKFNYNSGYGNNYGSGSGYNSTSFSPFFR